MRHRLGSALAPLLRLRPQTPAERLIAAMTSCTLLVGLVSVATVDGPPRPEQAVTLTCGIDCDPGHVLAAPTPTSAPSPAPAPTSARRPVLTPPSPRAAAPRVTPSPRPRPLPGSRQLFSTARRPAGVDAATALAMSRMQLSPEGYRAFLRHIDRSDFDYAQEFIEFDPDRVPIRQGRSQVFVWHFTAFYRNADGPSSTPKGDMEMRPFIRGLAQRGDEDSPADHVCCGVNWVIDRHGPAHQLAPLNAKLRHNPPYDSINTGVEIEAGRQSEITTTQYETTAYLTVAVLDAQRLLGRKPLSEIVKGHGEMRDAYREQHPDSHFGVRNDFDEPESRLLRQAIQGFLQAHPEVIQLRPQLA